MSVTTAHCLAPGGRSSVTVGSGALTNSSTRAVGEAANADGGQAEDRGAVLVTLPDLSR